MEFQIAPDAISSRHLRHFRNPEWISNAFFSTGIEPFR